MSRQLLKFVVLAPCLVFAAVPAAACGFGRWRTMYAFFAQAYALAPGIAGDYLRVAFYRLTLRQCPLSSRVSFGSFFAHPESRLGRHVYIGAYCIIGTADIGERTQIASGVQILSGKQQHIRDEQGAISGAEKGVFTPVRIGANCWIGAAAVIMADVGAGTTIGAGSVVSRPIPASCVAVGSPARVVKTRATHPD